MSSLRPSLPSRRRGLSALDAVHSPPVSSSLSSLLRPPFPSTSPSPSSSSVSSSGRVSPLPAPLSRTHSQSHLLAISPRFSTSASRSSSGSTALSHSVDLQRRNAAKGRQERQGETTRSRDQKSSGSEVGRRVEAQISAERWLEQIRELSAEKSETRGEDPARTQRCIVVPVEGHRARGWMTTQLGNESLDKDRIHGRSMNEEMEDVDEMDDVYHGGGGGDYEDVFYARKNGDREGDNEREKQNAKKTKSREWMRRPMTSMMRIESSLSFAPLDEDCVLGMETESLAHQHRLASKEMDENSEGCGDKNRNASGKESGIPSVLHHSRIRQGLKSTSLISAVLESKSSDSRHEAILAEDEETFGVDIESLASDWRTHETLLSDPVFFRWILACLHSPLTRRRIHVWRALKKFSRYPACRGPLDSHSIFDVALERLVRITRELLRSLYPPLPSHFSPFPSGATENVSGRNTSLSTSAAGLYFRDQLSLQDDLHEMEEIFPILTDALHVWKFRESLFGTRAIDYFLFWANRCPEWEIKRLVVGFLQAYVGSCLPTKFSEELASRGGVETIQRILVRCLDVIRSDFRFQSSEKIWSQAQVEEIMCSCCLTLQPMSEHPAGRVAIDSTRILIRLSDLYTVSSTRNLSNKIIDTIIDTMCMCLPDPVQVDEDLLNAVDEIVPSCIRALTNRVEISNRFGVVFGPHLQVMAIVHPLRKNGLRLFSRIADRPELQELVYSTLSHDEFDHFVSFLAESFRSRSSFEVLLACAHLCEHPVYANRLLNHGVFSTLFALLRESNALTESLWKNLARDALLRLSSTCCFAFESKSEESIGNQTAATEIFRFLFSREDAISRIVSLFRESESYLQDVALDFFNCCCEHIFPHLSSFHGTLRFPPSEFLIGVASFLPRLELRKLDHLSRVSQFRLCDGGEVGSLLSSQGVRSVRILRYALQNDEFLHPFITDVGIVPILSALCKSEWESLQHIIYILRRMTCDDFGIQLVCSEECFSLVISIAGSYSPALIPDILLLLETVSSRISFDVLRALVSHHSLVSFLQGILERSALESQHARTRKLINSCL